MKTITIEKEVLFTCVINIEKPSKLSLCKQSYSDSTCHFTLQNESGFYKVEHSNSSLNKLIEQIEHELKIEQEYKPVEMMEKYSKVKEVYEAVIKWKEDILYNLRLISQ